MHTLTLSDADIVRILDALAMMAEDDRDADDEHEAETTYALMTAILKQRGV